MHDRFPFPAFPDGWFAVAYSDEIARGEVRPVEVLGRSLVLFRSAAGTVHALDAHCAHLGAHLGYGGSVVGETIRCPFHGWCYDGQGECVEVPDAARIPVKSRLTTWEVRERAGAVLLHHSRAGARPAFEVPDAPELAGGRWTRALRHGWTIRTHVQEVCENLADVSHFGHLHGLPRPNVLRNDFGSGTYRIVLDSEGNLLDMTLYGLGVELSVYQTAGDEPDRMFAAKFMTPLDEERIELRVVTAAEIRGEDVEEAERRAALFADVTAAALLQDVPIWEHKHYRATPQLSSVDGPIPQFRRWAAQFYGGGVTLAATP